MVKVRIETITPPTHMVVLRGIGMDTVELIDGKREIDVIPEQLEDLKNMAKTGGFRIVELEKPKAKPKKRGRPKGKKK